MKKSKSTDDNMPHKKTKALTAICGEKLEKFAIRRPNGTGLGELEGYSLEICILPGWKFFVSENGCWWRVTESRSGARFPIATMRKSRYETIAATVQFCERQGSQQCINSFRSVIDKYGEMDFGAIKGR